MRTTGPRLSVEQVQLFRLRCRAANLASGRDRPDRLRLGWAGFGVALGDCGIMTGASGHRRIAPSVEAILVDGIEVEEGRGDGVVEHFERKRVASPDRRRDAP